MLVNLHRLLAVYLVHFHAAIVVPSLEYHDTFNYTLLRCATFPTTAFSYVAQPGNYSHPYGLAYVAQY
jgi:hypothetical protein